MYRPVLAAFLVATAALLIAAAFVPAPLTARADLGDVPNPVKAAWFLVWIQEVVSYAVEAIYLVGFAALAVLLLPYLDRAPHAPAARWFSPERRPLHVIGLTLVLAVLAWTVIGLFFRGPDWQLVPSF
ncbi:MAG: cytochrome B6 [Deltaproteobacteria bacterium HGW-Deltaproteobacteria-14]|nr:MAG: cytochrome B6 [Deltaproteobacteria bacterium HGW-Deltaproteobacteria-14]